VTSLEGSWLPPVFVKRVWGRPLDNRPVFCAFMRNINDLPVLGRSIWRQKALLQSVESSRKRSVHWRASRRLCRIWTNVRPLKSS
jgi:hypothetical protein